MTRSIPEHWDCWVSRLNPTYGGEIPLQEFLNAESSLSNDLPVFNFNTRYNLTGLDQFPSASLLADTLEGNGIIGNGGNGIQQTNFNPGLGSLEIFEPYIHESIDQGIYVTNPKAGVSPTTLSFINIKANVTTIEPSSFPKIASLEDNIIKVSTNNSTVSPITINKFPIEEAASHQRVLQVASNQIGHLAELPYTVGEIAVSKSSTKSDAGNFGRVFNANILENGSRKIDSNQFNSTSLIDPIVFPSLINSVTTQPDIRQDNVLKGSFPSVVSSQQIFSGNFSHDHTSLLNTIYSTAQTLWHIVTPINLAFNITNLPTGQLAEATITGYDKLQELSVRRIGENGEPGELVPAT